MRSTRNASTRHAESLKDDQSRLACRALLMALHGNLGQVANTGELIGVVEQVLHVLHHGHREAEQLPVAVRAAAAFALDVPRRTRDVQECLRLLLRHLYALGADYVPRELRDDARFRATSMLDVLDERAKAYLDDASFAELQG